MKTLAKLLFVFAVVAFLSASSVSVKAQAFRKNDFVLNAGIGFGSVWGYDYGYGVGGASMWPTIFASGEMGIVKIKDIGVISAGGEMAFRHVSVSDINFNWNEFYIAPRGAFHLSILKVEDLDVYGGVSIGLRFFTEPDYVYSTSGGYHWEKKTRVNPYGALYVGGRYYFSKGFGVFSELGYDITVIKLGVVFKF